MLSPRVRPYLFKWAVMSAVALLAMHVQVTTRFLSVTPGVYWFLAKKGFAEAERERRAKKQKKKERGGSRKKDEDVLETRRDDVLDVVFSARRVAVPDVLPVDVSVDC
jgi:hypothetical protein